MILCLTCWRLWPKGSKFCGYCARSFGCCLCPKGHQSPPTAKNCTECSSKELSKPGRYLSLRPISYAVALLTLLTGLRLVVFNAGELSNFAYGVVDAAFGFVAGISLAQFLGRILRLLFLAALPFVLGWIFFERGKRPSVCLSAYWRLLSQASRLVFRTLQLLAKAIFAPKKDKAKPKRKEA